MRIFRRIAIPFLVCSALAVSVLAGGVNDETLRTLRKHALAGEYEPVRTEVERLRPEQTSASPP